MHTHFGKRVLNYFCGTSFLLFFLLLFLLFGTSVVTETSITEIGQTRENSSSIVQRQIKKQP